MNSESEKEYNNFIKNIKQASLYDIKETAEYGDELITLTTCSYYTEDGRFVVVGRKSCHGDGDFWQLKNGDGENWHIFFFFRLSIFSVPMTIK